jgi:hypothetical protein
LTTPQQYSASDGGRSFGVPQDDETLVLRQFFARDAETSVIFLYPPICITF